MKGSNLGKSRTGFLMLAALGLLLAAPVVQAASNQGTGDIAGIDADLADSNVFNLNSTTLALVKRAFTTTGTPIADGASLPRGTLVKFMIYVNNNTTFPVTDMSVRDVLDPLFAYQAGTIKVDNAVAACAAAACTGAEEAAIFASADAQAARTDAVDADVASYSAATTTIDAGNQNVANGQLDVAASTVWAVVVTVRMQ